MDDKTQTGAYNIRRHRSRCWSNCNSPAMLFTGHPHDDDDAQTLWSLPWEIDDVYSMPDRGLVEAPRWQPTTLGSRGGGFTHANSKAHPRTTLTDMEDDN